MGEPVRILDMAKAMVRLQGLQPEVDIPFVYTGLRPGEKLQLGTVHRHLRDDGAVPETPLAASP